MQDRISFRFGVDDHEHIKHHIPREGSRNCGNNGCCGGCGKHMRKTGFADSQLEFKGL